MSFLQPRPSSVLQLERLAKLNWSFYAAAAHIKLLLKLKLLSFFVIKQQLTKLGTSQVAWTGTRLPRPVSVTLANVQVLKEPGRHFTTSEGAVVLNTRRLGSLCTHGSAQLWTIKTAGEDPESGVTRLPSRRRPQRRLRRRRITKHPLVILILNRLKAKQSQTRCRLFPPR